jgi:UDP-N-acetylglucosamine acyltransferase
LIAGLDGIDPRAVVHADARLDEGVAVGPFAVIGPQVRLAAGVRVGPHTVIDGDTSIGPDTVVYPFASIGLAPQDMKYAGEPTVLRIGARNVIRENTTLARGTEGGGGKTTIGDDNYFMAYSHVAHDCHVGDGTIFANGATLAGHVEIGDEVTVGAFSAVHQHCRVGPFAFIGGFSVVTRDALPYCLTVGSRTEARCHGVNRVGLRRKSFAAETVRAIQSAYRTVFRSGRGREEGMDAAEKEAGDVAEVRIFLDFVRGSRRGVIG